MIYIIFLIIGILIGGGVVVFFVSPVLTKSCEVQKSKSLSNKTSGLIAYTEKRREIMEMRMENILELLRKQETIVNDDVEKLLNVSDATATNYLQELEERGKIVQEGSAGGANYKLK